MNDQNAIESQELEILFYMPPPVDETRAPVARRRSRMPIWERLADQLGSPTQRLEAQDCLKLFPTCSGETVLEITTNLASNLPHNKQDRLIASFLLLSICTTLDISGRAAPEEIDKIIQTLTTSKKPKYLDKLKRGARTANEAIAEWVERNDSESNDRLHQLDQATQAILQSRYQLLVSYTCRPDY